MEPYWQSSDRTITVYHAPYEDVLDRGLVPIRELALTHADPPYGVKEQTDRRKRNRGKPNPGPGSRSRRLNRGDLKAHDYPAVAGDDEPFDPTRLLVLDRPLVIWGGHLCEPALPRSTSWIIWDKREDTESDDNGDAEMAWTNLGGPVRRWSHLWRGTCRASETGVNHLGPTQKPEALSRWVFEERAKLHRGDLVFVSHGGTGPDLPAARALGLRIIWCDLAQWCCDVAVARLPEAPTRILERASAYQIARRSAPPETPVGPLFDPR